MRNSELLKLQRLMDMGKSKEAILEEMKPKRNGNKRQVPEGGISLREASRRYKIPRSTLSYWLKVGLVNMIKQIGKFKYLDESQVKDFAKIERRIGVRTIEK